MRHRLVELERKAPGAVISAGVQATVQVTAVGAKERLIPFQGPKGEIHQVRAGPGSSSRS